MQAWERHADAYVRRAGDELQRARLDANRGFGAFLVPAYGTMNERIARARKFYFSALDTFTALNAEMDIARIKLAIGETYSYDETTHAESEDYYQQAVVAYEALGCENHPGAALGRNALASFHLMRGDLDGIELHFLAPRAGDFRIERVTLIPEPAALALAGAGLAGAIGMRRRWR